MKKKRQKERATPPLPNERDHKGEEKGREKKGFDSMWTVESDVPTTSSPPRREGEKEKKLLRRAGKTTLGRERKPNFSALRRKRSSRLEG